MPFLGALFGAARQVAGGWQITAIAAGVAFVAGATAGGTLAWELQAANVNAERLAHVTDLKRVSDVAAAAEAAHLAKLQLMQQQVAASDQKHLQELNDARADSDRLSGAAAAGRLSIAAECPAGGGGVPGATSSPGLGHAAPAGRAVLDPATGHALIAIAAAGDQCRAELRVLQDYARTVSR